MQFTAAQIALMIQGKVEGNAAAAVSSFGKIEEASAGQIAFLSNPKYEEWLYQSGASIIIVNDSLELKQAVSTTLIRVPDAYAAFAVLLSKYQEIVAKQLTGIQQPSFIAGSAKLGTDVYVAAFCYIGERVKIGNNVKLYPGVVIGDDTVIGDDCVLNAGVKVYHQCIIGNRVIVHAGTVIGGDGFGFAPLANGSYSKIPQIGNVIIEDDVEIGSNTTIDRATLGSTIIRKGSKLDNLIQVAHNVEIGSNTVIAAQAGISGSAKVGNQVMIGGQVGTAGHILIADGSKIAGQAGVTKSIKIPNRSHNGTPASEFTSSLRIQALTRRLPEMEERIRLLEKTIQELLADKGSHKD
jgi:UDP-3-O-[3-hydroxymyristoyl] glucosamine N-acyltransferase